MSKSASSKPSKIIHGSSPRSIRANIKLFHGAGKSHKVAVRESLKIANQIKRSVEKQAKKGIKWP